MHLESIFEMLVLIIKDTKCPHQHLLLPLCLHLTSSVLPGITNTFNHTLVIHWVWLSRRPGATCDIKGPLPGPWRGWRIPYPSSPRNVGPPGSWAPWKGIPWTSSLFCACSRSWPAWTPRASVEGQSEDDWVMWTACFTHNTWQDKRGNECLWFTIVRD